MIKSHDSGLIVEIELGSGTRAFGRTLRSPVIEFFPLFLAQGEPVPCERLLEGARAFTVPVRANWIRETAWTVISTAALTKAEDERFVVFCKQDMLSKQIFRYWEDSRTGEHFQERIAFHECQDLEVAAVWEPKHVIERLEDLEAGRPSARAERLRPKFVAEVHGTEE